MEDDNKEGLDKEGLDKERLDKEGLDKEGLDKEGLDEEGLDKEGLDEEGLDKERLDKEGERRGEKRIEYGKLSAFLGLLFLIASWVFYRITVPGSILSFIMLAFGILFIVVFFVLGYSFIVGKFSNRGFRRGLFSFLTTIFILAFLVTVYVLASTRLKYSVDMTEDRVFELSLQSVEVLKKLLVPIRISVFDKKENLEGGGRASSLPTLLRFYKQESDNIELRYIDPVKNPALFRSYNLNGVQDIGSLVFSKLVLPERITVESMDSIISSLAQDKLETLFRAYEKSLDYTLRGGLSDDFRDEVISIFESVGYRYDQPVILSRRELFRGRDYQPESKITSAIASIIETSKYVLYVSTGHGEKSFDKEYSNLKDMLSLENYTIKEVDLTKEVPSDASLVLLAGPQRVFNSVELDNLKSYSNGGGSLFILLDPVFQYDKVLVSDPLKDLLSGWQVRTDSSFVFDYPNIRQIQVRVGNLGGLSIAQRRLVHLSRYTDHSIVSPLKAGNIRTFFFGLRPLYFGDVDDIDGVDGVDGSGLGKVVAKDILKTSDDAFLKRGESTDQKAYDFNSKTDKKASYRTGLALFRSVGISDGVSGGVGDISVDGSREARLVIIGDSDFVNNEYSAGDNGVDLFMNVLGWLSRREKQITIRPKERKKRNIELTAQDKNILFYFSVLLLPFSVIGLGIYVYTRRKRG